MERHSRIQLHLISPPWAPVKFPNSAVGALKAYVDREFKGRVTTHAYSAFFEIPFNWRGESFMEDVCGYGEIGEHLYLLIYWARYMKKEQHLSDAEVDGYLSRLSVICDAQMHENKPDALTRADLAGIEKSTEEYVRQRIVPNLRKGAVNVVGFSMSYSQVYPSLLMARMIRELVPDRQVLFLFGGSSVSQPNIFSLLAALGFEAYVIFGEGEEKLVAVLKEILEQKSFTGKLGDRHCGVVPVGAEVDLFTRDEKMFRSSINDLDGLPLPDFDEYYRLFKAVSYLSPKLLGYRYLAVEGTRGCFGKCDFCNLNQQWPGFRKSTADVIVERLREMVARHAIQHVSFVDSLSDSYAERLAERLLEGGDNLRFQMNMRAHHMELFWAKLAAAGLAKCQVGIEGLSAPLLKHMNKGTSVIQNLRVLKYFAEYGIESACGLITHHPRATADDARETMRLLRETGHLVPVQPNWYSVGPGSPLYNRYTREQRHALRPGTPGDPPEVLMPFLASAYYETPAHDALAPDVQERWIEVRELALELARQYRQGEAGTFTSRRVSECGVDVVDTRHEPRKLRLKGLQAKLFELCHEGLKLEMIDERLNMPRAQFQPVLDELVRDRLVLLADSYYLTIAVRPVAECFARLGMAVPARYKPG